MATTAPSPIQSPRAPNTSCVPDLISFDSFEDSNHLTTSSVSSASQTVTANPFDECQQQQHHEDLLSEHHNTIKVLISGTPFSVDRGVFAMLEKLPWELSAGSSTYTLPGSPFLFEIVLNFLLFKTLPDVTALSPHDKEELEVMTVLLGLSEVTTHIKKRQPFLHRRRTSSVTSITIPEEELASALSADSENGLQGTIQKSDTAATSEDSASEEDRNSSVLEEGEEEQEEQEAHEEFQENGSRKSNKKLKSPEQKMKKERKNSFRLKKQNSKKDKLDDSSSTNSKPSTKGAMNNTVRQGFGKVFRRATSFPERLTKSNSNNKMDRSNHGATTTNKENSNNTKKVRSSSLKGLGSSLKNLGGGSGSSRQLTHEEYLAQHSDIIN